LAQCQFKVIGWDIMFICGMVFRCAGTIKPSLSLVDSSKTTDKRC